jgi:hypothetical protein
MTIATIDFTFGFALTAFILRLKTFGLTTSDLYRHRSAHSIFITFTGILIDYLTIDGSIAS